MTAILQPGALLASRRRRCHVLAKVHRRSRSTNGFPEIAYLAIRARTLSMRKSSIRTPVSISSISAASTRAPAAWAQPSRSRPAFDPRRSGCNPPAHVLRTLCDTVLGGHHGRIRAASSTASACKCPDFLCTGRGRSQIHVQPAASGRLHHRRHIQGFERVSHDWRDALEHALHVAPSPEPNRNGVVGRSTSSHLAYQGSDRCNRD